MNQLRACACLLAALLLSGCTAAGGQTPAMGHIAGKLLVEGGTPPGTSERPMSGTVTLATAGHHQIDVQVGSSGTFSVSLPPGRYQVSGGANQEPPCQSVSATVTAGHTVTVAIVCYVP
jgi:hypothetical protein